MKLPEEFSGTFLPELIEENVQVAMMGYKDQLPVIHTLNTNKKAIRDTKNNDRVGIKLCTPTMEAAWVPLLVVSTKVLIMGSKSGNNKRKRVQRKDIT